MIDTATIENVPDHELVRCIGSGSYGRVWLARSVTGSLRAIKIINRNSFPEARPYEREFNGIRKYEPVSRTHPGLVGILHVGQNAKAGYFYYVMELADDQERGTIIDPPNYIPKTIRNELAKRGRLSLDDCLQIGLGLAMALDHLHRSGLVHRDIKPANVVFINGAPKLADIGLVADIGEAATFVGTEGYVPPEGPGSALADLFGLGKLLYEASTGKGVDQFPALPQGYENDPQGPRWKQFYDIVFKACALNTRRRFQSCREMAEQLAALLGLEGGIAAINPPSPTLTTPERPRIISVGILSGLRAHPDEPLIAALQGVLSGQGFRTFTDQARMEDVEAARNMEHSIVSADAVVALLSAESVESEFLAYQLELAGQAAVGNNGKPRVVGIRSRFTEALPGELSGILGSVPILGWTGQADSPRLSGELLALLQEGALPASEPEAKVRLEPLGGAVPLASPFYVERKADEAFLSAIAGGESIVLVKGARQMGKTSLLARGLQSARARGLRVVLTDFQKLNASAFGSLEQFYQAIGQSIAEQMDLEALPEDGWDSRRSPNTNFERFLRREILEKTGARIVWGLDEVDRLFGSNYGDEVFGLFRSWHNTRALDPDGPWRNLTLAIAYATEAHLFIRDLNQSPFNVGTRLFLEDFDAAQIAELNRRYGTPVKDEAELEHFHRLVGGHPFLVRLALQELATTPATVRDLEIQAENDRGVFADHLRRLLISLAKDADLVEAVRTILGGRPNLSAEQLYRLRSSGLMVGNSVTDLRSRCMLYESYLRRHLK